MRVKRLTLQGFKSFARKTEFEFQPGVTAIVGPNGSGKSNVADAMRWVLGEQSNRLMRTKKQDEVVFNGSEKRPAMGVAEATLTLDNRDGWLPLDFAEVEIGRRVYRDGSSDYLLNGSQARLRDIQDVLNRAEVGQNSYAIIGQGLVDQVLRMNPVERRSLIDEAADIHVVRSQIRTAEDQLGETRANMRQVDLLVAEIEPRLRSLERQRERAGRHAELSRKLRALQLRAFTLRWQDIDVRLHRATASFDQLHAAAEASRERVRGIEDQLDALSPEIARRREAVARAEAEQREREEQRRARERQRERRRDQIAMLEREINELDDEIARLEGELAAMPAHPDVPAGPDADPREIAALERNVADLDGELRRLDQRFEREFARLREAELRITEIERIAREAEANFEGDDREELTARLEAINRRRTEGIAGLREYGVRIRDLSREQRELERRLAAYRNESDEARSRLGKLDDELRRTEEAFRTDVRELDSAQGRLDALRSILADYQGVTSGTRAVLEAGAVLASGTGELDGILDVLARVLRVPQRIEHAINAALEHRLHAVIVDSDENVDDAIAWLAANDAGRAQFIAMDSLHATGPVLLQPESGVVGVASLLVQCPDHFRPVVDTLLGRVIICEDMETARAMVLRGIGSVVTLDGIFLEPNGIITGGAARSDDLMFSRQRELDELPGIIAGLEQRVERDRQQLERARQAVDQVRSRASTIESSYGESRRRLDTIRAELATQRNQFARLRHSLNEGRRQRSEFEGRIEATTQRLVTTERQLDDLEREYNPLVRERERLVETVDDLRTERSETMLALTDARTAIEEVRRHQALVDQIARQQAEARERVQAQLEERRQRRELRAAEHQEHVEALAALDAEAGGAQESLESGGAPEDMTAARDELARLEKHERKVQQEAREANAALIKAERERVEAESLVERLNSDRATLSTELDNEGFRVRSGGKIAPADGSAGPAIDEIEDKPLDWLTGEISKTRNAIRKLGPINSQAPEDFDALNERYTFLTGQLADLRATDERLTATIAGLQDDLRERFSRVFESVNASFQEKFKALFGSGEARIELTEPDDLAATGIEIVAVPPGKRIGSLSMLSGGERSLTALAFLFALLSVNPAPFCVLDEVDAALDETNVGRLSDLLRQSTGETQFLVITHNRKTIEIADAIYGVSMGRDGISTVLSMQLDEVDARQAATPAGAT